MHITTWGHYNPAKPIETISVQKPFFKPDERIMVFDIDGVLLLQKPEYENGKRVQRDRYQTQNQAAKVFRMALNDADRVVIWTKSESPMDRIKERLPYRLADQFIVGAVLVDGSPVKNLGILTSNLQNIVAIEDSETDFEPIHRVAQVRKKGNLYKAYCEARNLLTKGVRCETCPEESCQLRYQS